MFQIIAVISVFFLIAAILVFCLKTHPGLRVYEIDSITVNITEPGVRGGKADKGAVRQYPKNSRRDREEDEDEEDYDGGGGGGEVRRKRQTQMCKYRTEAIGIDQKSSKPHPSFLVSFGAFVVLELVLILLFLDSRDRLQYMVYYRDCHKVGIPN